MYNPNIALSYWSIYSAA